jgi:uncharacterized protein (TIGR02611 family)
MSPGVEDRSGSRERTEPAMASAPGTTLRPDRSTAAADNGSRPDQGGDSSQLRERGHSSELGEHHEHHHHVLLEPEEDRWAWRRKIRQNPRQLVVYRSLVGLVGLLLICLGFVSGPLPGPGGIPLVLAGLAIWSTEFDWANDLMHWFKAKLHGYRTLSPHWKITVLVIFFACCLLVGFGSLIVLGVPGWLPDSVARAFEMLPLID